MLCKYLPFYSFSPGRVVDFRTVQASDFLFQLSRHSLEILPPLFNALNNNNSSTYAQTHTHSLSGPGICQDWTSLFNLFLFWWYQERGRRKSGRLMIRTQRSSFYFFTWEGTSRYGPRVDGSKKRERNLAVWKEEEEVLISTKITTEECLSCPACDGLPKTIGQRLISWIVVGAISPPALPTYKGERKQDSKSDSVQLLLSQSWLFILGPWNYSTVDREDFMFTSFLYIPSVGPWGIHLLRNPLLLLPSPSNFTMSDKR